ncbi:MAG: succinate dehydrogenase/fumarate reductase iron-sulfur subunit [Dehalococcoidia bacterium]
MEAPDNVTVRLFRYHPDTDKAPRYESYTVPYKKQMRILDALNYVYDEMGDGLGYRWYCGIKKCGECGIIVNGKPQLACWEPAEETFTCEPLTNFPIIRDLVVDVSHYEKIIVDLVPFVRRKKMPKFPEKLPHSNMEAAYKLSKCIECNVCTAAVPVKGIVPDGIDWSGYTGAAALVRFARFALDPRDELDRTSLAANAGLKDFALHPELADICPQGINVLQEALIPMKRKYFNLDQPSESGDGATTVFVNAPSWSAFVRLTNEEKDKLISAGMLKPEQHPDIEEAYILAAP